MSPTLLSENDIRTGIEVAIAEAARRERDDKIDIKITPFLIENAYRRQLFHIVNHPFRETSASIANLLLEVLGSNRRVSPFGDDYQPNPHVPALPSIARFLISNGAHPDPSIYDTVLMPNCRPQSLGQYYETIVTSLARFAGEELVMALSRRPTAVRLLILLCHEIPEPERR